MSRALVIVSLVAASQSYAGDADTEAAVKLLDAVTEGLERSQGVKRHVDVVVSKGSERNLAGSSSFDESIVGACFDSDLRPIAARLPGEPKGRDTDEQNINYRQIRTAEERKLNANLLKLFGLGVETSSQQDLLIISHEVTTKKWKAPGFDPLASAPPEASYCAVEATEGRTVDVLFSSKATSSGVDLQPPPVKAVSLNFEEFARSQNLEYSVKVRGFKPKEAVLPNYSSMGEVLSSVTDGAPLILNVLLVATKEQKANYKTKTVKDERRLYVYDDSASTYAIDTTGKLDIDVASSDEVSLSFSGGSTCPPQPKSTRHRVQCENTTPIVMTIRNPGLVGLGLTADVVVKVNSTTRQ